MEDYKKLYEESLKRAKIAHKDTDKHLKASLERIFPELAESEDEKIRKEIIEYIRIQQRIIKDEGHVSESNNIEKWISWLERKGEQKPAWNEEDESHIGRILSYLKSFKAYNTPHIEPIKKEIDWLKSLKDRMKGE